MDAVSTALLEEVEALKARVEALEELLVRTIMAHEEDEMLQVIINELLPLFKRGT